MARKESCCTSSFFPLSLSLSFSRLFGSLSSSLRHTRSVHTPISIAHTDVNLSFFLSVCLPFLFCFMIIVLIRLPPFLLKHANNRRIFRRHARNRTEEYKTPNTNERTNEEKRVYTQVDTSLIFTSTLVGVVDRMKHADRKDFSGEPTRTMDSRRPVDSNKRARERRVTMTFHIDGQARQCCVYQHTRQI